MRQNSGRGRVDRTQFIWYRSSNIYRTSFPVGICLANFTLAKLPLPMVFSNRYFPMCGSSEVRREELRTDAEALLETPPPPPPLLLPSDPLQSKKKNNKNKTLMAY